jgi:two-component system response regulator HydG
MAHILLVDDMPAIRRAIARLLAGAGHRITEAGNGAEGIAALAGERFDLVITDILMPGKDGIEVIMHVLGMPQRPRVLAMSGGGAQVPADTALLLARTKADAIMSKPFENEQMIAAVGKLLAA